MKIVQIAVNDTELYVLDDRESLFVYDSIENEWMRMKVPICNRNSFWIRLKKFLRGGVFHEKTKKRKN